MYSEAMLFCHYRLKSRIVMYTLKTVEEDQRKPTL